MNIIKTVMQGGGHVVILGAGASIASSIRDPEFYGHKLPCMNDLPRILNMEDLVEQIPEPFRDNDFEKLYSNLYATDHECPIILEMNRRIRQYFSNLRLPNKPTIYDILVMSLRPRDLIASFNWDPFLYQAFCRNGMHGYKPKVCFLHGNVAVGYDIEKNMMGPINKETENGAHFSPSPLLYPTGEKNYEKDPFIRESWATLRTYLSSDFTKMVTIFGYSAPKSDRAAVEYLKEAWGGSEKRSMEQFELIDIRDEEEVKTSWDDFIYSHHYNYHKDFFQSSIAQYPRRTSESFFCHYEPITVEEALHEPHPVPQDLSTLDEMWDWFKPLIDVEASSGVY